MRLPGADVLARWVLGVAIGLVIGWLSPVFFLVVASAAGIGWLCWSGADPVHARVVATGESRPRARSGAAPTTDGGR
jgi:hypothetical protein